MLSQGALLQGRYRVLRQIGGGGMSLVYLVEDTRLAGRKCAIKEMSPAQLAPQDRNWAINAFRQEAQMLANLSHSGLTAVTDFFPEGGDWYLVMDYVEGKTLRDRLEQARGGHLPLQETLGIVRQLCNVLEYLHGQTPPVVFRDLKPGNVMLTPTGEVKLIDFGIARFFKPGQTRDTVNLGTPGYAAPEQYGSLSQTDPRSDVYGLGALLHQMVTGHDPTTTPFNLPPPRQLNPRISPRIEATIQQSVQAEPSQRFQSVSEMRQALRSPFLPPLPWKIVAAVGGVLVALLACGALLAYAITHWPSTPPTPQATSIASAVGPTQTPAAISLTPTPVPSTSTPPVVAVLPTHAAVSPEQTIRDYYSAINNHQYDTAWGMLSTYFKEEFTGCSRYDKYYDCDDYVNWWSQVAQVDVGEVRIVAQTGDIATVYAELSYLLKNGRRIDDSKPYIQLVFDAATRTWLFYDKGPNP